MVQLNFYHNSNKPIGMINWFSVHATSMNGSNQLISGDNKGLAALLMEHAMAPTSLAGQSPFVAAFATTNQVPFSKSHSHIRSR